MHRLDLPAGARIRLIATARVGTGLHRWDVRLLTAGDKGAVPRLVFGSRIGDRDLDQAIDIPPQDVDCWVEICSRHAARDGWEDDRSTIQADTPDELQIGFCNAAKSGSRPDDLLLSFAIGAPRRGSTTETDDGQGSEAIQSRDTQTQAGRPEAGAGAGAVIPGYSHRARVEGPAEP